jgi:hypothetical protein
MEKISAIDNMVLESQSASLADIVPATPDTDEQVFEARDEGGATTTIVAASMADALVQAREWAMGGDYGEITETIRGTVIVAGPDGEESVEWSIDPEEPKCLDGEDGHDWKDDGCVGQGAATVCEEHCHRCGMRRTTTVDPIEGDTISYETAD